MSYRYEDYKDFTFNDAGQRALLRVRDFAFKVTKQAGCVRCEELMNQAQFGDQWQRLSIVDRLVELGDIMEVSLAKPVAGQDRLFVSTNI